MAPKIVVVGSFNADLTAYMERMPRPGETVHGRRFITGPGGKGSNQAIAAARLGAEVTFVGRIGRDVFAPLALNLWEEEGVNADYVVQDPESSTGVAPIFVDDTGENSIVVVLAANLAVSKEDVDRAKDVIADADIMMTQLEIDYETVGYTLKVANEVGVRTILNPAPAGQLALEYVQLVDYLTPNETELEVLSRMPDASIEDAARSLITSEGQAVIVTLGPQGARYVGKDGTKLVPSYKVDVVDTTGAGDAFNGGLAVALAEGKSAMDAIDFANAAAALCVTRPGAAKSMPRREEVEALLASSG
ncbi:MAG: ribokinase [Anaerolineales bacterium]|nr:ribokinase [Anaerolineales bacterium]